LDEYPISGIFKPNTKEHVQFFDSPTEVYWGNWATWDEFREHLDQVAV
jgi:hypothetical protein